MWKESILKSLRHLMIIRMFNPTTCSGPSVPLSAEETIPSGNDIEEERRREQEEIDRLIEMEIARLD